MLGSNILEIAIGIFFVFFIFSLMITAATEMIAAWLKLRAGNLWKGIRHLIETSDTPEGKNLFKEFYEHPLIKSLTPTHSLNAFNAGLPQPKSPSDKNDKKSTFLRGIYHAGRIFYPVSKGPSYVPSRTFALALMDVIEDANLKHIKKLIYEASNQLIPNPPTAEDLGKRLSDTELGKRVVTHLEEINKKLARTGIERPTLEEIKSFADKIYGTYLRKHLETAWNENPMKKNLLVLLEESRDDMEKLKENVEIWFNNSMDRVSGWYKRKTQIIHIVLASVLAITMNVDSVRIIKKLSTDDTLRKSIVSQAQSAAQGKAKSDDPRKEYEKEAKALEVLQLPIGWENEPSINPLLSLQAHFLGWLVTVLAASLGAPFWFDMLNKVVTIRSAGKAPEEGPKKPKEVSLPLEPAERPFEAAMIRALAPPKAS